MNNKPESAYPLSWPAAKERTPAHSTKRALFSKKSDKGWNKPLTIGQATQRLMHEISCFTKVGQSYRVDPDAVIISSNLRVRLDGLSYSSQKNPDDVGVAVYFELDGDPYCFPCDKWDRIADNIAAVASHIGALRGIERWGVGDLKQAFTGWSALPSPDSVTVAPWRDILKAHNCHDLACVKALHRKLVKIHHPDHGGDPEMFYILNKAYEQAKGELG